MRKKKSVSRRDRDPGRDTTHSVPGFSLSQRRIFKFHDGDKQRALDPLEIQIQLADVKDWDQNVKLLDVPGESVRAVKAITDSVCKVFGVRLYDEATGKGLTRQQLIDLASAWSDFTFEKKSEPDPSPINSPSGEKEPVPDASP